MLQRGVYLSHPVGALLCQNGPASTMLFELRWGSDKHAAVKAHGWQLWTSPIVPFRSRELSSKSASGHWHQFRQGSVPPSDWKQPGSDAFGDEGLLGVRQKGARPLHAKESPPSGAEGGTFGLIAKCPFHHNASKSGGQTGSMDADVDEGLCNGHGGRSVDLPSIAPGGWGNCGCRSVSPMGVAR